jgi:hypothetical protein
MRQERKKAGPQQEEESEKALGEFAQLIAEQTEGASHSEQEPFEHYQYRLKAKLQAHRGPFGARFAKGYHVLLEELKKLQ